MRDNPAGKHSHREAKGKSQNRHLDGALSSECRQRAENDQGIHNRRGEHVGDAAGDRKPLPQETAYHGNNAAFAHRKDQSEESARDHRHAGIFRKQARHQRLGKKFLQESREQCPSQQERNALQEYAQKSILKIRQTKLEPGGRQKHGVKLGDDGWMGNSGNQ